MELLIGLLAELLFPFVMVVVVAIVDFVAFVIAVIAILVSGLTSRTGKRTKEKPDTDRKVEASDSAVSHEAVKPSAGLKWIQRTAVAMFAGTVVCLLAINFLFLKPVGNWVLAKLQQRTGIELVATDISGNLFTGKFSLTGLAAKRVSDEKSNFDLKVGEVSGDLQLSELILGTPVFETLTVNGVTGRFDFKKRDKKRKPEKIRPKRNFVIGHLMVTDVKFQMYNASQEALDVELKTVSAKPLRSQYAVFDLFFRSDVSGTLAGRDLEILSTGVEGGRKTSWKIEQLPVSVLGHFSDAPVLNWLEDGTVDIDVEDRWAITDRADVDMDWRILARNVKMQVPADASVMQKTVFLPAQSYLNRRDKPVDISFSLVMNEKQFEGAASLEAANLWTTVKDGFIKALVLKNKASDGSVQQTGEASDSSEEVRGLVDKTVDRFKDFLDKKRKPSEPDN